MNIMSSNAVVCPGQVPFFACVLRVHIHYSLSFLGSTYRSMSSRTRQRHSISRSPSGDPNLFSISLYSHDIHVHLKLPLNFKMEVRGTKSRPQYGRREFSISMTELDKLFRSFLRVECLCHRHSISSTCSRKKLVVRVYRMGFKALLIGRMKITTQDVIVPWREMEKTMKILKNKSACLTN